MKHPQAQTNIDLSDLCVKSSGRISEEQYQRLLARLMQLPTDAWEFKTSKTGMLPISTWELLSEKSLVRRYQQDSYYVVRFGMLHIYVSKQKGRILPTYELTASIVDVPNRDHYLKCYKEEYFGDIRRLFMQIETSRKSRV